MSLLANSNAIESGGYNIDRSLRFRSSASAYLNRTPASAGNQKTWTFSAWIKLGSISANTLSIFGGGTVGSSWGAIEFDGSTGQIYVRDFNGSGNDYIVTGTPNYRDYSAWYHLVVKMDNTQSTSSYRLGIWINGVAVPVTGTYPSQNTDYRINSAAAHRLMRYMGNAANYFDGYLAEVNFIDGQALTPSSFGQTDAVTGVWTPKKYTGTYGTNGFYLDFKDNTSATTLAYDKSGNGNNWTANNISTTAGATYDSMTDVPTMTSATAANYPTFNPLIRQAATSSNLVAGNLEQNTTLTGTEVYALSSFPLPASGKFYAEFSIVAASGVNTSNTEIGLVNGPRTSGDNAGRLDQCPSSTVYRADGNKQIDGGTATVYGATWGNGDTIGVAVNMDAASVTFYKNNASQGAITSLDAQDVFLGACIRVSGGTGYVYANFGQRPFAYTPPTGFKALNTFNLPDPTIKKPNQYMDATLYTGNGSTLAVTNAGSFQPELVWVKSRSGAGFEHVIVDASRGASNYLSSNSTAAEINNTGTITAFNSNGFTVGAGGYNNASGYTYVGWQWKESATAGFDIVTYTGTGANRTISHNLGIAPSMMIVKKRSSATESNWTVYHTKLGNTDRIFLNLTDASTTSSATWNNTSPTSSVFSVGTSTYVNENTQTYVAYLFAEIPGFSQFGSYTGNGSADGPFCYTGFKPAFVMTKRTDTTGSWFILDSARNTYNLADLNLYPNLSNAESQETQRVSDFVSNGFKVRGSNNDNNTNGGTYIYMAFASNPFKYSLAR